MPVPATDEGATSHPDPTSHTLPVPAGLVEEVSVADPLADLVSRFSAALLDKLRAAEAKYGHDHAWMRPDWQDDLRRQMTEHVTKGDPRDVAAYAAFAWYHGWSLAGATQTVTDSSATHRQRGDGNPASDIGEDR